MRKFSKDSDEVAEFMVLFKRLKLYSDDEPEHLFDQASEDSSVKKLCIQLWYAAYFLKMNERRSRVLFAAPVDPSFLDSWRDYESRYETILSRVSISDIFPELDGLDPQSTQQQDAVWSGANYEATEQASGIEAALEFAEFNIDQGDRWGDQQDFVEQIEEGIAAWDRLKRDVGFDLQGIFRRRALVPFVLVPRKVANRYGGNDRLSVLENLKQAHDAFIFGAPHAALALMRSIMESVLRDHYRIEGRDLSERINNICDRQPLSNRANRAALHRLRKRANAVLHLDGDTSTGLTSLDEEQLEREILSLLLVLRDLIEGVD